MKKNFLTLLLLTLMIFVLPSTALAKVYRANFINHTSERVRLAIVFNDVEDGWVNSAWASVPPNSSKVYAFDLNSPNIYIYAQTEEWEWSGSEDDPHYPIADQKFYYSVHKHPGANFYDVSFAPLILSGSETVDYEFE